MKRFILILCITMVYIGTSFAQNSKGIIRRKAKTTIGRSKTSNANSRAFVGSQRTVEFPKVEQKNDYSTEIVSVTLTKSQLVIKMSVVKTPDFDWISIDRNTIVVAGGKKYKIKDTDGIAFSPGQSWLSYDSEKRYFTLYFPPIPMNTKKINLLEPGDSDWQYYGIHL